MGHLKNLLCHLTIRERTEGSRLLWETLHLGLAMIFPLDVGSTGSRVHIYTYDPPTTPDKYASVRLPEMKLKTTPGLSAFSDAPSTAGSSLDPLIVFAKQQVVQSFGSNILPDAISS